MTEGGRYGLPPRRAIYLNFLQFSNQMGASTQRQDNSLLSKLSQCKRMLSDEYEQTHDIPWIVCFSGGKDSTLLLQLVFEMLLSRRRKPKRPIHVVANDTLVESPEIISHLDEQLKLIEAFSNASNLPVTVVKTTPDIADTFWVNLIGKGYATPNRSFRWCTSRLKIKPTTGYIKKQVDENGNVIVLLGVRSSESNGRRQRLKQAEKLGSRLLPHPDLVNCFVFNPILEISDEDLWAILLQRKPPWNKTHRNLITLYRNAKGGQCPTILGKSDAPMCGGASARFGCWTCTVVEKDRSLEGLIESGFEQYQPLVDFRNHLADIRNKPSSRMKRRRNGRQAFKKDGTPIKGPFTLSVRKALLDKLLALEGKMNLKGKLISRKEKGLIRQIWAKDQKCYNSSSWRK